MRRTISTPEQVALLAILLLAFGLRVAYLGAQELRGDESFGYFFMQQGYREMIDATVALKEPHPVASYFVQKAWMQASGTSEFALRFVSVWFSTLAVALLVRLARRLQMRTAAILAGSLLFAASPYAIWHAQDARMYSMSMALGIAVTWLAIEALTRRRWQWIVAYLVAALLALHTHYYVVYLLVALTIFVVGRAVVAPSARRAVWDWVMWNVILFVLYMPWLARASGILAGYGGNGDSPTWSSALERALGVFAVGETTPVEQRIWWTGLAVALLALGAVRLWLGGSSYRRTLWLLLCTIFVPLALTWYSAQGRPIFNERYLIVAAPYFYLLAGAALQPAPRARWLDGVAAIGVAALLFGMALSIYRYNIDATYSKSRGWREVAARAQQLAGNLPAKQVRYAQNYPDPTLWYYLPIEPHLTLPPSALDEAGAAREVAALVEDGIERVILVEQASAEWDGAGIANDALAQEYAKIAEAPEGNFAVGVYASDPAYLTESKMSFGDDISGDDISMDGFAVDYESLASGGVLPVFLKWTTRTRREGPELKSTLQLLGPDGAVVAQVDAPLPDGSSQRVSKAYGILLPEALPAGTYRLILAVYAPDEEGAPRLTTAGGDDFYELEAWLVE